MSALHNEVARLIYKRLMIYILRDSRGRIAVMDFITGIINISELIFAFRDKMQVGVMPGR